MFFKINYQYLTRQHAMEIFYFSLKKNEPKHNKKKDRNVYIEKKRRRKGGMKMNFTTK